MLKELGQFSENWNKQKLFIPRNKIPKDNLSIKICYIRNIFSTKIKKDKRVKIIIRCDSLQTFMLGSLDNEID